MKWNPRDVPVERPSSFDETGKRVFLYPAKVAGYFKNLRTVVYSILLFVFLVLPWTTFHGEQTVLLDIVNRKFVFFGMSFSAHDGPLIFFPLIISGLILAFVTSIWGRVWCGWACPQTVFLEAIFRKIDFLVEGSHTKRQKADAGPMTKSLMAKKTLKWFLFTVVCSHIAHSFTAYFVGAQKLFWITMDSPFESWALFLFVQILTLILLFNFGWFREQFCIIMCPYGRFQSVLMGHDSLAILYDEKRGEPRKTKDSTEHGDCVNCYKCVSVCPVGIDIRRGVQLECIACTACIDACNEVMTKIKKPKNLIGYTSVNQLEGKNNHRLNLRSLTYLIFIVLLVASFAYLVASRKSVDLTIVRAIEAPYKMSSDSLINHFYLVIANQSDESLKVDPPSISFGQVVSPQLPIEVPPGEVQRVHFFVMLKLKDLDRVRGKDLKLLFNVEGSEVEPVEQSIRVLMP